MPVQTEQFISRTQLQLLEQAADIAGSYVEVARRTGISRRRIGKIKAGSPVKLPERTALQLLAEGKL